MHVHAQPAASLTRAALLVGALLTLSAAAAAQPAEPFTAGRLIEVGSHAVEVPSDGRPQWEAARASAGVEGALPSASPSAVTAWVATIVADDTLLAWERASMAVAVEEDTLRAWDAELWLDALAAAEGTPRQRATWALVATAGGAAALLPPSCMPEDPALLLQTTAAERVFARRDRASVEAMASMPSDADVVEALGGPGGGAVAASLAFIAAGSPSWSSPDHAPTPGCDPAVVAAVAVWGDAPREERARDAAGMATLAEALRASPTGVVPAHLLRRIGVHAYLDMQPTFLDAVVATFGDLADPRERVALTALAAGARGDADAMEAALRDGVVPNDPYGVWVLAESARQSGESRDALRQANEALAIDPYFVAAYLTRGSALLALGRGDEALADVAFLNRAFGSESRYGRWIGLMERALRR